MIKLNFYFALLLMIVLHSCTNSQNSATNLAPIEFSKQLKATPNGIIMDVRTPQEFAEGHIKNAINLDWNGSDFNSKTAKMDKSTPVFVYCLSGGRSSSAASQLRADGFKNVLELNGGMMSWRNSGLKETKEATATKKASGITKEEFSILITSDKIVIVDFFAPWCGPCKKMKPHLDEIAKKMSDKVVMIALNVDENPELANEFKIEGLPTVHFYKKGVLINQNLGYMTKEEIVKHLN